MSRKFREFLYDSWQPSNTHSLLQDQYPTWGWYICYSWWVYTDSASSSKVQILLGRYQGAWLLDLKVSLVFQSGWTILHFHHYKQEFLLFHILTSTWFLLVLFGAFSVQFSHSVMSTLWDPMDCSTPGFPIGHQFLELTQTHVHRVSDAIQPSHPRSSSSPPAPNPSQHQGLF